MSSFVSPPVIDLPPVIELRKVKLAFGREVLLENVNLSIAQGEVFVLVGPSGQGKSVLLKILGGLITPTSGDVLIEGKELRSMRGSEREALVRRMGMLFQKNALFDSLSVGDNVAFPMREVLHEEEEKISKAVENYLQSVGILHAKDLFPDEISGGMQKRLGIARAIAMKPEIIFYDDPTAGLDPITSRKIVQLIIDLRKEYKSTVVAVTNDMNRAYQMCTRIGMVVDRELIITGNHQETLAHPDKRVQQFIHGSLQGPLTVQVS